MLSRACKVAIKSGAKKLLRFTGREKIVHFRVQPSASRPDKSQELKLTRGKRGTRVTSMASPGVGVNVVNDPVTTIRPTGTTIRSDRITRLFL